MGGARNEEATLAQCAWVQRVRQLAAAVPAKRYDRARAIGMLDKLHTLTVAAEELRHVPAVLSDMGMRFVVCEHLAGTKIDGVATWTDERQPVIGISVRYDRIDGFWHTLAHEVRHIINEDETSLDVDLIGKDRIGTSVNTDAELAPDREASEFLVPAEQARFVRAEKSTAILQNEDYPIRKPAPDSPRYCCRSTSASRGHTVFTQQRNARAGSGIGLTVRRPNRRLGKYSRNLMEANGNDTRAVNKSSDQYFSIVELYLQDGGTEPIDLDAQRAFAINNGHWHKHGSKLLQLCKRDNSRAFREQYHTDPQGRAVRTYHAATSRHGDSQQVFWADMRTAPLEHMEAAFLQRREQIVGDCSQLKRDVDSFNDNNIYGAKYQLTLDFGPDVDEREQPTDYRPKTPK